MLRAMVHALDRHVLVLVAAGYQDLELWYPRLRLVEAGARVTVAGPAAGVTCRGLHGYPCVPDLGFESMTASAFDAVLVPGGGLPDRVRRRPEVLDLVRGMTGAGKPVAAICRGGLVPASAGVYDGVRVTSDAGVREELERLGARWQDAPVVVDGRFVSGRGPDDLPAFCQALLAVLGARD
jgi:protease I